VLHLGEKEGDWVDLEEK